jgi:hypothetical protein
MKHDCWLVGRFVGGLGTGMALAAPVVFAVSACTVHTEDNFTNPPPGPPASCTTVAALDGCSGGSVSYTCTGDRPDDGDTSLVCSKGTPGASGTTLYCCAPYGQPYSECTVNTTIAGCNGYSIGFACSGETAPDQADSALTCSPGEASGAEKTYCCTSTPVAPTCAPDPSVPGCSGVAIGYSCVGAASPDPTNTSLTCGTGTPGMGGTTRFCCEF